MTPSQLARAQHLSPEQREMIAYLIHNLPNRPRNKETQELCHVLPDYFTESFFGVVNMHDLLYVKLADRIVILQTYEHYPDPDHDLHMGDALTPAQYKKLGARLDEIAQDPRMIRHRLLQQTEVTRPECLRVWELREFLKSSQQVPEGLRVWPQSALRGWNHLFFAIDGSHHMFDTIDGSERQGDSVSAYEPNAYVLSFQPDVADRNSECHYKPVFSKPGRCIPYDITNATLIPLEGEELLAAHARWKFILSYLDTNFERNHRCSLR